MESLFGNLRCGKCVVKPSLLSSCCGNVVVEPFVVESFVVESLLWNLCCGNFVVEYSFLDLCW